MYYAEEKAYVGLLQAAAALDSVEDIEAFLFRMRDVYGVLHISHALTGIAFSDFVTAAGTIPKELLELYRQNRPADLDPVLKRAKLGVPIIWSTVTPETEVEAYFFSRMVGLMGNNAVTIPLSSVDESTSTLTIVSDAADVNWNKRLPVLIRDFLQIGMTLHRRALEIQGLSPPSINLSTRHIDVLKLLATGMNEEQISRFLDISERSVKQYISETKIRLRSRSKVQAVATAIANGYLDL